MGAPMTLFRFGVAITLWLIIFATEYVGNIFLLKEAPFMEQFLGPILAIEKWILLKVYKRIQARYTMNYNPIYGWHEMCKSTCVVTVLSGLTVAQCGNIVAVASILIFDICRFLLQLGSFTSFVADSKYDFVRRLPRFTGIINYVDYLPKEVKIEWSAWEVMSKNAAVSTGTLSVIGLGALLMSTKRLLSSSSRTEISPCWPSCCASLPQLRRTCCSQSSSAGVATTSCPPCSTSFPTGRAASRLAPTSLPTVWLWALRRRRHFGQQGKRGAEARGTST